MAIVQLAAAQLAQKRRELISPQAVAKLCASRQQMQSECETGGPLGHPTTLCPARRAILQQPAAKLNESRIPGRIGSCSRCYVPRNPSLRAAHCGGRAPAAG